MSVFTTISQLRTPVKIILAVAIVTFGYFVISMLPKAADNAARSGIPIVSTLADSLGGDKPITLCVNTWGGFAGAQYMNGGFEPNDESRFTKDYGIHVRFIKMDDFDPSRAAFASGDCDFLWATIDAFVTEAEALAQVGARVPFQIDWSRGGDAVVAVRDIKSVNDLRGRKVGVAFGTPSHSLLLWLLNSSGMNLKEIQVVQMKDEPAVAAAFKAGSIDVGIVWSPTDADLLATVPGAHVLTSTKQATNIIADTVLVKASYLEANRAAVQKLYEGWMAGNAAVSHDQAAFQEAVKITAAGYGMSEEFMAAAIRNTRLTTHGDNRNFFGLNAGFTGMKADELYSRTGMLYQETGFLQGFPSWRAVVDTSIVAQAQIGGAGQEPEAAVSFAKPTVAVITAPATATKPVIVTFALNSAVLDDTNKSIIDRQLVNIARQFRTSYIRIEGNTDSTGDPRRNVALSGERAASVADYLVAQYQFDASRFVSQGNGSGKPACDETLAVDANSLAVCRGKNRRTEFQILAAQP
jgi:NitT/TauT family transport system substrate-binding protein